MAIWQKPAEIGAINAHSAGTAIEYLGIEITEVGDDYMVGRVPVDHRTKQPFGLLHGGISVVLAESIGSMAAFLSCPAGYSAVGLEINANHLRAVRSGWVTGTARPAHLGRTTQVWNIEMRDDRGKLCCISRLTMAILPPAPQP